MYESLVTDGLQIAVKMSSLVISLTGQKNQFTGALSVKIFKKLFCVWTTGCCMWNNQMLHPASSLKQNPCGQNETVKESHRHVLLAKESTFFSHRPLLKLTRVGGWPSFRRLSFIIIRSLNTNCTCTVVLQSCKENGLLPFHFFQAGKCFLWLSTKLLSWRMQTS